MYCYHYTTCTSQVNERSCVLLPLHYLYKSRTMSCHMYCYHYTTCTKLVQSAVMCIITITLPVQNEDNEWSWSCILLPLHYLCKARTMSGHGILPPSNGIWSPIHMVYRPPLPMVFWRPAYLLIRDEGVKIPWGFNLPYRGVCFQ